MLFTNNKIFLRYMDYYNYKIISKILNAEVNDITSLNSWLNNMSVLYATYSK